MFRFINFNNVVNNICYMYMFIGIWVKIKKGECLLFVDKNEVILCEVYICLLYKLCGCG